MNASRVRFEVLIKEHFYISKIQMRTIPVKNAWDYVNGSIVKLEAVKKWTEGDFKAPADIGIVISPLEI